MRLDSYLQFGIYISIIAPPAAGPFPEWIIDEECGPEKWAQV